MPVFVSHQLEEAAKAAKIDLTKLVEQFAWWKADPDREFRSFWFGKDGAYQSPDVDGRPYELRHCHLPPSSEPAKTRWAAVFKKLGRKTSDRVLVYARRKNGDYLLIYVLDEPGAHEIAEMRTKDHERLMRALAEMAAVFLEGDDSICRVA